MAEGKGYGGKTVYGARVGILMLDTKWPRPPGDTGNALTWPFPVLYKVVPGASARVVIHEQGKGLGPAFLKAAEELVKDGADGITTTGGFLAIFQDQLSKHVNVPVASSSLLQVPLVQRLLPPGKRVGVLSVQGNRITPEHWDAVGAPHDTPVMGTEGGREFTRVMLGDTVDMDYEAVEDWPEHKRRIEDFALGHLERLIPGIRKKIVVAPVLTVPPDTVEVFKAVVAAQDRMADRR